MIKIGHNCERCPEKDERRCDGLAEDCICRVCPRKLGQCIITRYCRETESTISF